MKDKVWVLVANGSVARLYGASNGVTDSQPLEEIEVFEHPETRVHSRDLVSGKAGRSFNSSGNGRHALEPELTPQKNEAHHFAETLANHLEHSRRTSSFSKLYLIASPSFLGMLRGVLHSNTKSLVALEVDKDATSKTPEEFSRLSAISSINPLDH